MFPKWFDFSAGVAIIKSNTDFSEIPKTNKYTELSKCYDLSRSCTFNSQS